MVAPRLLKAERAEDLCFPTGDLFLFLLLSHAGKESPSSPGAEWDELRNEGEVSVSSQVLPAPGFCERGCGGSVEAFLVLGCGWVARLI